MVFSLFAALVACMHVDLSLQVSPPSSSLAVVASSGSLARAGVGPLGTLITHDSPTPALLSVVLAASPSQGLLSERVRAQLSASFTALPLSCAFLAPRDSSESAPPGLVHHLMGGMHSSLVKVLERGPIIRPSLYYLSTSHSFLAAYLPAHARVSGGLSAVGMSHRFHSLFTPWSLSLVEASPFRFLSSTTISSLHHHSYYHNHYMMDWSRIVDFQFVWSRWFPVSLSILPRSKWGPPPSKPFYREFGCFICSFIFTSEGRSELAMATSLCAFAYSFYTLVEETAHEDRCEASLHFLVSYIVVTQVWPIITHQVFTLTPSFLSGVYGMHALFVHPFARRVRQVGRPVDFTRMCFWFITAINLPLGQSVCLSCAGNDPNCSGDSTTCVLAQALVANCAVVAGVAGAATTLTMGESGKHILPLSWLQVLKPSVLNTLQSLSKKAPSGTPLDVPALSIKDLSAAITGGRISVSDGRFEFIRRMADDGVTPVDLNKMEKICSALPMRAEDVRTSTPLNRLQNSGALSFVFALSSQIVHRLSTSSKTSLSVADSSNSSLSGATVSMDIKRPQSSESFSHMLVVWQSVLSATGLANAVILGPFLVEVVYDIIPFKGWKVAFEHFLLYIAKIDSGCGWQIATATSQGSHDTFLHKAERAAGVLEPSKPPPASVVTPAGDNKVTTPPGLQAPVVWNGKFNSDPSARPCAAHNLGQDHIRLNKDGSCPHNHCCDRFISGKGPGAQCRSVAHTRSSCDHADKAGSKTN